MISIVVPCYNVEKYLRYCIDSILNQTFSDYELLLVDDGSTDRSQEICAEYAATESRVRLFSKKNGGASTARNVGIEHARGEWITFVDADDILEPDYLSMVIDIETDWVFASWKTLWDDQRPVQIHDLENQRYEGQTEIRQLWNRMADSDICRCPWGKFFKRSIIEAQQVRFDPQIRYGEDTLFNYQYLRGVSSISLRHQASAHYLFHQSVDTVAVHKYRCTPEGIVAVRDQVFNIFYDMQLSNIKFERLFFFCFTMLEHCYLGKEDDTLRHQYYRSEIQHQLEKRCLKEVKFLDRWMYLLFKYVPHALLSPIAKVYLQYR